MSPASFAFINNDLMSRSNSPRYRVEKHTRPSKRVRLTLPPSPPLDVEMTDTEGETKRRSARIHTQTSSQVVFPTEAPEDIERLRSGSKWRQRDLKLLRVKFDPAEDENLDVLNVDHEWTDFQRRGMFFSPLRRRDANGVRRRIIV